MERKAVIGTNTLWGSTDITVHSAHWCPGPPIRPLCYDPVYDINGYAPINIIDTAIVSSEWNQTW